MSRYVYSKTDEDLQRILRHLGFEPTYVDGKRGPLTDKAVTAFLASEQGAVHASTLASGGVSHADIGSDVLVAAAQQVLADRIQTAIDNLDGLSLAQKRDLQRDLKALSLYDSAIDGLLGARSQSAIETFKTRYPVSAGADTPDLPDSKTETPPEAVAEATPPAAETPADATPAEELPIAAPVVPAQSSAKDVPADTPPPEAETAQTPAEAPLAEETPAKEPLPEEPAVEAAPAETPPVAAVAEDAAAKRKALVEETVRLIRQPATRETTKSLQSNLTELGFDTGGVDGRRGSKTTEAITAFEATHAADIAAYQARIVEETRALIANPDTLTASDNTARKQLQDNLNFLGLTVGTADGVIGPKSQAQITAFEKKHEDPGITAARKSQIDAMIASEFKGGDALLLEKNLDWLGLKPGKVDGILDQDSYRAIGSYLRGQGGNLSSVSAQLDQLVQLESPTPDQYKAMQQQLSILGIDPGAHDGKLGLRLASALTTYYALKAPEPVTLSPDQAKDVQRKLRSAGYSGNLDGILGAGSIDAFNNFIGKTSYGLPALSIDETSGKLTGLTSAHIAALNHSYPTVEERTGFLFPVKADGVQIKSGLGFRIHPILGYRKFHEGTDYGWSGATIAGTDQPGEVNLPLVAPQSGVVTEVNRGIGKLVLQYPSGYEDTFHHMSYVADYLKVDAPVKRGDFIGNMGDEGRAKGVHLHLERRLHGALLPALFSYQDEQGKVEIVNPNDFVGERFDFTVSRKSLYVPTAGQLIKWQDYRQEPEKAPLVGSAEPEKKPEDPEVSMPALAVAKPAQELSGLAGPR